MRRILAALAILIFASSVLILSRPESPAVSSPGPIAAESVSLDPADPTHRRVGELEYLGGWVLWSGNPEFGGISAMTVAGDRFTAVGDAGGVFRFRFADGRISDAHIGQLPAGPAPQDGRRLQKSDRDAESMAGDIESGWVWIGFERANAIWRYSADFSRAEAHRAPEAMKDWPSNGGAEALVRLADGRFLVFSEEGEAPAGSREALLFPGDPSEQSTGAPIRFGFRPAGDYAVTDAAQLPDGRILILMRRFTIVDGVSMVLGVFSLDAVAEDRVVESRAIATLAPPLTVDNMEALAISRENGRTILWIASDDNFNPLQRTLLLKFALAAH